MGSGPPSGRHKQLFWSTSATGKEIGSSVSLGRGTGWDLSGRWDGERGSWGEKQAGRRSHRGLTAITHQWAHPPSPYHQYVHISLPVTLMQCTRTVYKVLGEIYYPYHQNTGSRSQAKIARRYNREISRPRLSITHPMVPHFLPQWFQTFGHSIFSEGILCA